MHAVAKQGANQMKINKALVVFSGGQDSTTCLGVALSRHALVETITFDYGQRHAIEMEAARRVVEFFVAKTGKMIASKNVGVGKILESTSPLTSDNELETYNDHDSMEAIIGDRVEKTFVPMRNALFLTIAFNRAVAVGANVIYTGVCQADNANYPDCTESFISSMEAALNAALGNNIPGNEKSWISIDTPLMHLSKAQSIRLALETPHTYDALAFSHTAYDGKYPPTGKDHASILRAHGFEEAGVPDPLVLRAAEEGLMDLPETANYDQVRYGE